MVFNDVANTNCRDHSVKDEADASDDGRWHGADDFCHFWNKAKYHCIACRNADNLWIMNATELKDTGVLSVGGVCRTTD